MKKIVFIVVFACISFSGKAQDNNSIKEGFNQFFYGTGQVSSEGMIRNGKPDGLWKTFHVNGKIKSIGLRRNFELDSIWNFYDDSGNLLESISYLNGKKSGYHLKYHKISSTDSSEFALKSKELYLNNQKEGLGYYYDDDGKINNITRYKGGKRHGLTREFNEDSVIQVIYKYHNDFMIDREFINQTGVRGLKQGLWREYYENDNIKIEKNYKDNILNGYYREYDQKGRVLVSKFYSNGEEIDKDPEKDIKVEIVNQYDDSGKIVSSGGFVEGVPIGLHREYTDSEDIVNIKEYSEAGQVVSQGIMDDKGLKNEFWKFYFPGGGVRSEGVFSNNLRSGEWKFYYPDGKLEQKGFYREGKTDGLWVWYYSDGSVLREENYYRGKEDGMSVEYDRFGNIIAKGEYIEGNKEGEWYYNVGDQVEKGNYSFGLKDGTWRHYFPDGKKKFEGAFVQGNANGKHKIYYDNGKLKEDQFWEMGMRTRTWRKYDREGNILLSTTYENDVMTKINGVKVNSELN